MKFQPLHFSWAALPPQPRGIVVFVGGAFFGSFPTLFYRAYLRDLVDAGFGVVALPFRFSAQHWDIALSLAIYQPELKEEIQALLQSRSGGAPQAPGSLPYIWIAHSLGSKYIALLELLSESEDMQTLDHILKALNRLAPNQARQLKAKLELLPARAFSLRNQPQLLVDPVITDLEAAIPVPLLRKLFAPLIKVNPSRRITLDLIKTSQLFSLTTILSLASDTARSTVQALEDMKRKRPIPVKTVHLRHGRPALGRHLAILGLKQSDGELRKATLAFLETAYPKACEMQGPQA